MLKLNYFLADIFILSAEKQPIKLSWRKIEWLQSVAVLMEQSINNKTCLLENAECYERSLTMGHSNR